VTGRREGGVGGGSGGRGVAKFAGTIVAIVVILNWVEYFRSGESHRNGRAALKRQVKQMSDGLFLSTERQPRREREREREREDTNRASEW